MEFHVYITAEFPYETLVSFEETKRALNTGKKIIYTTQTYFLQTDRISEGYRLFIHAPSEEFEIKLGGDNNWTEKEIRLAHNLCKLILPRYLS